MSRSMKRKRSTRLRMTTKRVTVIAVFTSATLLMGGWFFYLNFLDWKSSKAGGNETASGGVQGTSGEVLCEFTWEHDAGRSTQGPDVICIGGDACVVPGGRASTKGLSPGGNARDINLVFRKDSIFNVDGLDISVDFRKLEPTGYLFCRTRSLEFWIDRGYPAVLYRTYDVNGGYAMVNERSAYEIPDDGLFRNYRFIYNPVTGKGEIFVNGVIVWSHQGTPNTALYWKGVGMTIIGKGLNGNGHNEAILDNLVIRSTGSVVKAAESLISFNLETRNNGVQMTWTVDATNKARRFIIEKSVNAVDFVKIGEVSAHDAGENPDYEYFDKTSQVEGTFYYRLKQVLQSGNFVNHQPSAIRPLNRKEAGIDNVTVSDPSASMDVTCFIPETGPVKIQVYDPSGMLIRTENFSATSGSNIYVIKDLETNKKGTYTVNLIYNNQKVSRKMVKG